MRNIYHSRAAAALTLVTAMASCGGTPETIESSASQLQNSNFEVLTVPPPATRLGEAPDFTRAPVPSTTVTASETSAFDDLIGFEFDVRATDANNLAEIPSRLGLAPNYQMYASLTIWSKDGLSPSGTIQALTPDQVGSRTKRIDTVLLIAFLTDGRGPDLPGRIIDAVSIELTASEDLSLVHNGCLAKEDPNAVVFGTVEVGGKAASITQQPRRAWHVFDTAITERPPEGVICELAGTGEPSLSTASD